MGRMQRCAVEARLGCNFVANFTKTFSTHSIFIDNNRADYICITHRGSASVFCILDTYKFMLIANMKNAKNNKNRYRSQSFFSCWKRRPILTNGCLLY